MRIRPPKNNSLNEVDRQEIVGEILAQREPFAIDEFADDLDITVELVEEIVESLNFEGYRFEMTDTHVIRLKVKDTEHSIHDLSDRLDWNGGTFGVVSDSHLSSKKERKSELWDVYGRFRDRGIDTVLHIGDLTDGINVHRGWEAEVLHHTQNDQINYFCATYPKIRGMETFAITGNHDLRAYERGGVDPGVHIAQNREDITYLGQMAARITLPQGIQVDLLHPAGGLSYALSYKAQKYIQNLSPREVPHIMLWGHYHTSFYMHYRDVHYLQVPCFKDQGTWEKRLGLNPTIGAWIVSLDIEEGKITRFVPELLTY